MSSEHPIRVFLCDDGKALRSLMRFVLEEESDIEVVGEAADGRAGVDGVAREKPDVVLLDLSMPILDGLEAIPLMLDVSPGGRWPTSRRAPTSTTSPRPSAPRAPR